MRIISKGLASIFLLLALLHFAWFFGSSWGIDSALPKDEAGNYVLNPAPWESAVVGITLLFFGIFYLIKGNILSINMWGWLMTICSWLIPIIFLFRAVGDFRYVGFFKGITTTDFAWMDTFLYSPLCLLIAIAGFVTIKRT